MSKGASLEAQEIRIDFAVFPEAYKEQYAKWRYEDLPILPENWKYEVPKDKKTQLALLCRLMKDKRVDSVVCATDAGREGELIFRLVYEYA